MAKKIESEPDLKYYIDNDYITKLINLLIEGIGDVVEENNKKIGEGFIPLILQKSLYKGIALKLDIGLISYKIPFDLLR